MPIVPVIHENFQRNTRQFLEAIRAMRDRRDQLTRSLTASCDQTPHEYRDSIAAAIRGPDSPEFWGPGLAIKPLAERDEENREFLRGIIKDAVAQLQGSGTSTESPEGRRQLTPKELAILDLLYDQKAIDVDSGMTADAVAAELGHGESTDRPRLAQFVNEGLLENGAYLGKRGAGYFLTKKGVAAIEEHRRRAKLA